MPHIPNHPCPLCGVPGAHHRQCRVGELQTERDEARAALAEIAAVLADERRRGPQSLRERVEGVLSGGAG